MQLLSFCFFQLTRKKKLIISINFIVNAEQTTVFLFAIVWSKINVFERFGSVLQSTANI